MILGIVQARVSSSRLPEKVLKPILGKPMLLRQVERLKHVRRIDELIIATSIDMSDDLIETLCKTNDLTYFRGNLDDVLDRFYQAAVPFHPNHVVRITGDCPLIDPEIIDRVVEVHLTHNNDYTSNTIEPTFPDGLDVEVIRFECLKKAWENAKLKSQREHVTPYIYQNRDSFKIGNVKNETSYAHLRWTVDEPEDFELIQLVYENLYNPDRIFLFKDIVSFIEKHPELIGINQQYERNEGYKKSINSDGFADNL